MIKALLVFLYFLSLSTWAFSGGISGFLLQPNDKFRENIGYNSYGFQVETNFNTLIPLLKWGLIFRNNQYGRYKEVIPFSEYAREVYINKITENYLNAALVFMRIISPYGKSRPYLDIQGGFHALRTQTELQKYDSLYCLGDCSKGDFSIKQDQVSTFNLSYGFRIGILVEIFSIPNYDLRGMIFSKSKLYLDLSINQNFGGNTRYYSKGSIKPSSTDGIQATVSKSPLNYTNYNVGLSLRF